MPEPMQGSILGNAVKRVEDPRFIRGEGRYLDDIAVEGVLHLVPVRSPIPHGTIESIDVDEAVASPGVVAVFTAADLELGTIRQGPGAPRETARPPIARDRVRFVGEVVAVVVAETERAAVDAADLVWADIEPLDAVADVDAAVADGAPILFPEVGTNVVVDRTGERDDDLFAGADVVVEARFRNQRLAAVPLETNNALAEPGEDGTMTLWVGSQNVFGHRPIAYVIGMEDKEALRVRVPDMGGGFGAKFYQQPEQVLTAAAAKALGRPVKWVEPRTHNLVGMTQGRAQDQVLELGLRRDGTIVALRATLTQDTGAYPTFGAFLPSWTALMASGTYRIPRIETHWRSIVTNTVPVHAYRGAGRPEAAAMLERIMDMAAAELGVDPVALRRRNLLAVDDFPYESPTGASYDTGDYAAALDRALAIAGYDDLRAEQARRREAADRVQLGIGVSTYVEITAPGDRMEWSKVEVHDDGTATAWVGTSGHGQGHETAFAQLVANQLGIPHTDVKVVEGDTAVIARGDGTGGSRSLQVGGSAVHRSTEGVVEKAKRIVAHVREVATEDLVVADGGIAVAGVPDTAMTWAEIARLAADPTNLAADDEPGLAFEEVFDQGDATYPFGAHVSVVEIDTETGSVSVRRHVAVDDCGTIFNRILVDGQVHGGVAQGYGQALYEQVRYDEWANPLTGNLTTYLIPTASTTPAIEIDHTETPALANPLGAKGIGESGTIGSTAAVWNAVNDALAPFGVRNLDMPATADRVWTALRDGASRASE